MRARAFPTSLTLPTYCAVVPDPIPGTCLKTGLIYSLRRAVAVAFFIISHPIHTASNNQYTNASPGGFRMQFSSYGHSMIQQNIQSDHVTP
eukprot:6203324-Pleurochrysis_carterae.AAC.4